jgi:hypothetical protein
MAAVGQPDVNPVRKLSAGLIPAAWAREILIGFLGGVGVFGKRWHCLGTGRGLDETDAEGALPPWHPGCH